MEHKIRIENIEYYKSIGLGYEKVIAFKIECKSGPVYLCAGEKLKDKYIVFVKPKIYLKMWKNTATKIHHNIANMEKSQWLLDDNFENINDLMKVSNNKHVYLIEVFNTSKYLQWASIPLTKYQYSKSVIGINIKDGLTRSMCLLIHLASVIPVVCYDKASVHDINEYGGICKNSIFRFEELYKTAKPLPTKIY